MPAKMHLPGPTIVFPGPDRIFFYPSIGKLDLSCSRGRKVEENACEEEDVYFNRADVLFLSIFEREVAAMTFSPLSLLFFLAERTTYPAV